VHGWLMMHPLFMAYDVFGVNIKDTVRLCESVQA
jgi:hypothetical protein